MKQRREFLVSAAGAMTVATAGCLGSNDDDESDGPVHVPVVEFEFEGEPGETYTITHNGGDSFDAGRVVVEYEVGVTEDRSEAWGEMDEQVSRGDTFETSEPVTDESRIMVGWQSAGNSEAIGFHEVPPTPPEAEFVFEKMDSGQYHIEQTADIKLNAARAYLRYTDTSGEQHNLVFGGSNVTVIDGSYVDTPKPVKPGSTIRIVWTREDVESETVLAEYQTPEE